MIVLEKDPRTPEWSFTGQLIVRPSVAELAANTVAANKLKARSSASKACVTLRADEDGAGQLWEHRVSIVCCVNPLSTHGNLLTTFSCRDCVLRVISKGIAFYLGSWSETAFRLRLQRQSELSMILFYFGPKDVF